MPASAHTARRWTRGFEALKDDRKGQYSLRINQKNRVCFKWASHASVPTGTDALMAAGDAYDVEIVIDYHLPELNPTHHSLVVKIWQDPSCNAVPG